MASQTGSKQGRTDTTPAPISGLRLSGFKSIRDESELEIRNLTLLAGKNSAGKTSVMQPLLLLKQTLEAPFDPGPLLLDGRCLQVRRSRELFWAGSKPSQSWFLEIRIDSKPKPAWYGVRIGSSKGTRTEDRAVLLESTFSEGESRFSLDGSETAGTLDMILRLFGIQREDRTLVSAVERIRSVYNITLGLDIADREQGRMFRHTVISPLPAEQIRDIIYLPGLRGKPERHYPSTGVAQYPGRFDDYIASILDHWKESDPGRLESIGQDLQALKLADGVEPRRVDETSIEILVPRTVGSGRRNAKDLVNLVHVGFGVSQVLPVLVALRAARPGQLVHIEQPEVHLHPNAQVQLAKLLVSAAKRGVRVVVETHSSLVLKAVQLQVSEGFISPDDVALHWFSRDKSGATRIDTADLDRKGTYGDWPVDFADVELDVAHKFLRSQF